MGAAGRGGGIIGRNGAKCLNDWRHRGCRKVGILAFAEGKSCPDRNQGAWDEGLPVHLHWQQRSLAWLDLLNCPLVLEVATQVGQFQRQNIVA